MLGRKSGPEGNGFEGPATKRGVTSAVWAAVALLLAVFAAQNIIEMRRETCSSDEVVHLPAGYTYLVKQDFRLNPEHPPLIKELCALPLLWLHPKVDFNNPNWTKPRQASFGYDFLYSNNADQLLFWGRLPVVLLAVLLGFFVFRWAQQLYGNTAGIFALGLYAFSPNIITHAHLVTTDLGLAAFTTITFYFLWRYLRKEKKRNLIWAGLAMGAALASKFSAAALFPVALFLLLMFHQREASAADSRKDLSRREKRKRGLKAKPSDWKRQKRKTGPVRNFFRELFSFDRRKLIEIGVFVGIAAVFVQLTYIGSLNPWLYFHGMKQVDANHNPLVPGYLHGSLKAGGCWYYFIVAFLVKASAPLMLLIAARFFLLFKNWKSDWRDATFMVLPSVILFWAISAMADPLGVRYVLPVFPLMMIFSSGIFKMIPAKKLGYAGLWCLLAWHIVSSVRSFPYSMSYFSDFVGGPSHGRYWLDDSNVDWGQNLKRLKTFLDEKGIHQRIILWSFSPYDNPAYYGIQAYRPSNEEWVTIAQSPSPPPGVYAISEEWLSRLKALGVDWMKKYPLIGQVGYTMFVFKIP